MLRFKRLLIIGLILPLLWTCTSCATLTRWVDTTFSPEPLELSIRQIEPAGNPGHYRVTGRAALPDQTQVTVSAIRYLNLSRSNSTGEPVYAVLDRQFAEVSQKDWETTLNLWQVAPDGKFQEAWQLNQQSLPSLQPESDVTFLVTLEPSRQPDGLRARVENQDKLLQATLSRFTTDGELYLQAQKALTISLPTGSTSPPLTTPVSNRQQPEVQANNSSNPQETESPTWRKTNDPLSPDQFFR